MKKFNTQGFTLIELIVSVAIAGILLAVGIPSLQSLSERGKLNAQLSTLVSSMKLARSEAVAKSSPVILCASGDGESCRGSDQSQWEKGWFIFLDRNQDGDFDKGTGNCLDTEDCVLRYSPSFEDSDKTLLRSLSNVATFTSEGTITVSGGTNSGANQPLRISICSPSAKAANDVEHSAYVEVQPSGAIRTIRGTDSCP